MHKIKEKIMDELYEVEEKIGKSPNAKLSAGDLEYIHKLTDTAKNIGKIEMLEGESEGYSRAGGGGGGNRGGGNRGGGGGNRGGGGGRGGNSNYSGDDWESEESYESGESYARRRRDSRGRYSRDDGKEMMVEKLEHMMEKADDNQTRSAIKRCIREIERD